MNYLAANVLLNKDLPSVRALMDGLGIELYVKFAKTFWYMNRSLFVFIMVYPSFILFAKREHDFNISAHWPAVFIIFISVIVSIFQRLACSNCLNASVF